MGFAPEVVAVGVVEALAGLGLVPVVEDSPGACVFRLDALTISVGPLPPERESRALFHPRSLLAFAGDHPRRAEITAAIRARFMRAMG